MPRVSVMTASNNNNQCKSCGSHNLFDTCLDKDGYAVTDGSGRWTTICLDCDRDQNKPKSRGKKVSVSLCHA